MNGVTEFLYQNGTALSIALRVLSSIIMLFFFIPLQIKEALVKNGLRRLRIQLLTVGIIIFITNILTGYILWAILVTYAKERLDNIEAQLLNAIASVVLSLVLYRIYRFQYSDKSKDLHAKIALQEKKQ